jgi:hypothetical protein
MRRLALILLLFAVPAFGTTSFNVWTPEGNVVTNPTNVVLGNPSVIYEGNAKILSGTVFKMWTGGLNSSTNHAGLYYFESADGVTSWTAYSSNPVIDFGAISEQPVPTVYEEGGTYYCYEGLGSINAYTSTDGISWTSKGNVLSPGSAGAWDSTGVYQINIADVISGTWYAYYAGNKTGNSPTFQVGLITSSDGLTWTKSASNPVITGFGTGTHAGDLGGISFLKVGSKYYAYAAGNFGTQPAQLVSGGLHGIMRFSASSVTGPWTQLKYGGYPIPTYYPANPADFPAGSNLNAEVGDQRMVVANGNIYMYYTLSYNLGAEVGINAAVASSITPAQLVATYEGVVGAPISGFPQLNLSSLASDNFQRADGALGANWTPISTSGAYAAAQIVSHEATVNTQNNADSYYSAITWTSHADQWSQVTAGITSSTSDLGAEVRMNTSGTVNSYRWLWGGTTLGSSASAYLQKEAAGSATTLLTITGLTVSPGDTLLEVNNGTLLYIYWNGFLVGSVSDSTYSSGAAGLELFSSSHDSTKVGITGWSGGTFQSTPPIPSGASGHAFIF